VASVVELDVPFPVVVVCVVVVVVVEAVVDASVVKLLFWSGRGFDCCSSRRVGIFS
jgi:hypothetical protein